MSDFEKDIKYFSRLWGNLPKRRRMQIAERSRLSKKAMLGIDRKKLTDFAPADIDALIMTMKTVIGERD